MFLFAKLKMGYLGYLLFLIILSLFIFACSTTLNSKVTFEEADVIGAWQANYDKLRILELSTHEVVSVSGIETLVIREDGTYVQEFRSQDALTDIKAESTWRIDPQGTVSLHKGLWPQLGPNDFQEFHSGKRVYSKEIRGTGTFLNGSEAILLIKMYRSGELYLEHLPTGDPDNPILIQLKKVQ